jgi:hypothetical protein
MLTIAPDGVTLIRMVNPRMRVAFIVDIAECSAEQRKDTLVTGLE